MEFEITLENEQQFWDEIQEIVSAPCSSEDHIDNALRCYLSLATKYKGPPKLSPTSGFTTIDEYLQGELDVTRCLYKLLASSIFASHADYVRRQMIYCLLQDDDPATLHLIASFLLFDGCQHEEAFRMMNEEGSFPRLLELLQVRNRFADESMPAGLHRLLMDLLYEMSRIQRVKIEDLVLVDDEFVRGLFDIIEDLSYDVSDPYHYPVIRVLLVLNEQFMISAHDPVDEQSPMTVLTNKVIKVLSMHGNLYKTFGENIILLINREGETSLQLLTLKLLYLIFTTPSTYEYFYTNDLHVLVDILIRNLLDLPEESSALRHTYLRVLYPLLAHTQLRLPPYYKRENIKRVLSILVNGQLFHSEADQERIMHFADADDTTRRLVLRCAAVDWIREEESTDAPKDAEPLLNSSDGNDGSPDGEFGAPLESTQTLSPTSTVDSSSENLSPTRADDEAGTGSTRLDAHRKLSQAQRLLGMHHEPASSSTLSVQEVASQHEAPGVITPSRNNSLSGPLLSPTRVRAKVKPLPPKTRRWRGRPRAEEDEHADQIPEDREIQTTSPLPPPTASGAGDRRNSTSTSSLTIPVPRLTRRSASNPPPAVPPPRRSTHSAVPGTGTLSVSSHCTPLTSPSRVAPQLRHDVNAPGGGSSLASMIFTPKHGQKPEPPKTRRAGRGRHPPGDSSLRPESPAEHELSAHLSGDYLGNEQKHPLEPPLILGRKSDGPVSVEEAVQNMSVGDGNDEYSER
ncbi:uncharacterized protein BP01DRAFT_292703 [Aspergillus saccharolyticus JOP 1030-1]|uniref:SPIN90/Ldb17 leucine-rich domain-containing protein n=1 Tax=Aspergillus saccharolyticus JOP 1030-1 TaxID=1450539 RepID=A0A318ZS87_9EURO|nr:hypothetical protein BP01DRAFT_292703 [Aspergillus saccharolyticus JOP 1030-1]PYH46820.1 hypothetical protein BP01DRAFT_292703 [Aspergillus saccharolyticus JOP 1030-1]